MNWLRKVSFEEVLSTTGLIMSVIGQASYVSGEAPWANAVRVLGLALFLAGIILTLRKIVAAVERQKDDHDVLNMVRSLAEINAWSHRDPNTLYVRATGEVLQHIVSEYVPRMTSTIDEFRRNPAVNIEVTDHSPIFDLMYRIGKNLPPGSAWMGITRLEKKEAWTQPLDDGFSRFRALMRTRARSGELSVFRLYSFEQQDRCDDLLPEIQTEIHDKLIARTIVGEDPPPPDISLIWIPRGRRMNDRRRHRLPATAPTVSAKSWLTPLCVMVYDTRAGALLTKLVLAPGKSDLFNNMADEFDRFWANSREIAGRASVNGHPASPV